MSILLNIIFWVTLTFIGTLLVMPLTNYLTKLERIGLGLLIGAGFHATLYFLALKFSNSVFPSYYLFPIELTITFVVSRLPGTATNKVSFHLKSENMIISLIGVIIGIMILSYTLVQATFWPVYEPDAIHLYDYRAKRLLLNDKSVLFSSLPYEHNSQYPPFTSLFHLFLYQNGLLNPKVMYPILYITWYICILGYLLRKTRSPILSIWGANIIIASPNIWWQSFQAMTNVPYMIYLSLGGIYLSELNSKNIAIASISGLLTAIAIFIRLEPIWISGLLFLTFISIKYKNPTPLIIWITIVISSTIPWRHLGPKNDTVIQQISGEVRQILSQNPTKQPITGLLLSLEFLIRYYLSIIIIYFIGILVSLIRTKSITQLQLYGVCLIATIMLGIFNIYYRYPQWYEFTDSIRRMMIVIVPIIWVGFIQESSKVIDQL